MAYESIKCMSGNIASPGATDIRILRGSLSATDIQIESEESLSKR